MGCWNLRVIEDDRNEDDIYYFVAEVFYNKDNSFWGFGRVEMGHDTYNDLKEYYEMISEAFEHPAINIKEFNDTPDIGSL